MSRRQLKSLYGSDSPNHQTSPLRATRRSSRAQSCSPASFTNDGETSRESAHEVQLTTAKKPFRKKVGMISNNLDISASLSDVSTSEEDLTSPPMKLFRKREESLLADLTFQESVMVNESVLSTTQSPFRKPFSRKAAHPLSAPIDLQRDESALELDTSTSDLSVRHSFKRPFSVGGVEGTNTMKDVSFAESERSLDLSESISTTTSLKRRPFQHAVPVTRAARNANFSLQYDSSINGGTPCSGVSEPSSHISPKKRPFNKENDRNSDLTLQYAASDCGTSTRTSLSDSMPAIPKKKPFTRGRKDIAGISVEYAASTTSTSPYTSLEASGLPSSESPKQRPFRKNQKIPNLTLQFEVSDSVASPSSSSATSDLAMHRPFRRSKRLHSPGLSLPDNAEFNADENLQLTPHGRRSFRKSNRPSLDVEYSDSESSQTLSNSNVGKVLFQKRERPIVDTILFEDSPQFNDTPSPLPRTDEPSSSASLSGVNRGSKPFRKSGRSKSAPMVAPEFEKSEISGNLSAAIPERAGSSSQIDASHADVDNVEDLDENQDGAVDDSLVSNGDIRRDESTNRFSQMSLRMKRTTFPKGTHGSEEEIPVDNLCLPLPANENTLNLEGSPTITRNPKSLLTNNSLLASPIALTPVTRNSQRMSRKSRKESLVKKLFRRKLLQTSFADLTYAESELGSHESSLEESAQSSSLSEESEETESDSIDEGEEQSEDEETAEAEVPNESITTTPAIKSPSEQEESKHDKSLSLEASTQKETPLQARTNTPSTRSRSRSSARSENLQKSETPTPIHDPSEKRKSKSFRRRLDMSMSSQVSTQKETSAHEGSSRISNNSTREPENPGIHDPMSNDNISSNTTATSSLRRSNRRLTSSITDSNLLENNMTTNNRTLDYSKGLDVSNKKVFSRKSTNIPLADISYMDSEASKEHSSLEVSEKSSTVIETESESESDKESDSEEEEEKSVEDSKLSRESIAEEEIKENLSAKEKSTLHESQNKVRSIEEKSNGDEEGASEDDDQDYDVSSLDYTAPIDQLSAVADDSDILLPTPEGDCTVLPALMHTYEVNASIIRPEKVILPYLRALYSRPLPPIDWAAIEEGQRKLHEWTKSVRENGKLQHQQEEESWNELLDNIGRKQKTRAATNANLVPKRVKRSPVRLVKPARWANARLYKYLSDRLIAEFGIRKMLKAEEVVIAIHQVVKLVLRSKAYEKEAVDGLKRILAELKIIETTLDFYAFVRDFLPREFEEKVVPSLQPLSNIVWPPKDGHKREHEPIL